MSHDGEPTNMSEDEKVFRKAFFDMTEMVKVLYEERKNRMVGESSKPPHGEGSSRGKKDDMKDSKCNGGNPLPSPPYSSSLSYSSSSTSQITTYSTSTTKTVYTH